MKPWDTFINDSTSRHGQAINQDYGKEMREAKKIGEKDAKFANWRNLSLAEKTALFPKPPGMEDKETTNERRGRHWAEV